MSDFAAGVSTVTTRGGQAGQLRKLLGNKWTLRALSLAVLLGLWQVFGNKYSTSFPSDIARTMPHSLRHDVFPAFGDTFKGFFTGYAVCILTGIPIGLLMARSRLVELILEPYIVALYATPRLALIPVLILWFGIDFKMRFMVVLVSGFFPIVLNTWLGAKEVDQNLLDAGRAFNAGALRTMRTIVIPATLPFIFAGLRLGMARSLIGIIVAEIETSVLGIGNLISTDVRSLRFDEMWVAIIALGVFSIIFTMVLKALEQWATMPWQRKGRLRLWPSYR